MERLGHVVQDARFDPLAEVVEVVLQHGRRSLAAHSQGGPGTAVSHTEQNAGGLSRPFVFQLAEDTREQIVEGVHAAEQVVRVDSPRHHVAQVRQDVPNPALVDR